MGWQGRGKRTTYDSRVQGHDAAEETEARFARGKLCHESDGLDTPRPGNGHDLIASKKSSDDESDWPETADALRSLKIQSHFMSSLTKLSFSSLRSDRLCLSSSFVHNPA